MSKITLASRTFDGSSQASFARISGDCNPLHMDPIAARRTQAGAVVVHGVHGALWALDKLAELGIIAGGVVSLSVQFKKFTYLGDRVDLNLVRRDETSIVAELTHGALTITTLSIGLGTGGQLDNIAFDRRASPVIGIKEPANLLRIEDVAQMSGWLDIAEASQEVGQYFPNAASVIGQERTAAIAMLSTLVGMVCPGLHSLFAGLSIKLVDTPHARDGLNFFVSGADDRFRIVRMNVVGGGISGSVQAFLRWPSVAQAAIHDIAKVVSASEFAGSTALIIGGSRGLGALTAKIVAAGGGEVVVTYAQGRIEAAELAEEIRSHVGRDVCRTIPYDAREEAARQLACLGRDVSHLYYFATPPIAKQKEAAFDAAVLDEFMQVYVKGFYDCCCFVAGHAAQELTAFYPSSVFVENGPAAMIEYVMAKRAGEMLCENINRSPAPVRAIVSRLPRLLTDQTATVPPVAARDPLDVMLPIIRQVQGRSRINGS